MCFGDPGENMFEMDLEINGSWILFSLFLCELVGQIIHAKPLHSTEQCK